MNPPLFRWLTASGPRLNRPAAAKLARHDHRVRVRTDRMFAVLMLMQWVGGIVTALVVSPRTWIGGHSHIHPHVTAAVLGGGLLASLPIYLAVRHPGRTITRMVIGCSQVLFSTLLIHLSGGRIETHFHVFGSLAFLAAYRDPRVLTLATVIVAADHFVRGVWWPQSVFGVATAGQWRWLEHAAWVIFEDVFLIVIILQSRREMVDLAVNRDRMERRESELEAAIEAATHAGRTKDKFLANMSHEIRTPLNGILGFTDVLIRDRSRMSDAEIAEQLGIVHRSGKHLLSLITDILDLSKIQSDRMTIESVAACPARILSDAVSVLRVTAHEKGLKLEHRWDSPPPSMIRTDPRRLKQLILNLIGNAIKFTHHGSVIVHTSIEDIGDEQMLRIEVRDTGIGISPEHQRMIFDPFVQADDSITRRFGGTGLGLAISRQIARSLGGDLTVQSVVGRGSTFVATISAGGEGEATADPAATAGHGDLRRSTAAAVDLDGVDVLVVDDGDTNRKLIRLLLERGGARVRSAENGQVAVAMAQRFTFDIILMDMQMPVLDGYSATRQIRNRGHVGPIIALTAHASEDDRQRCRQAGCDDFITKPVDAEALLRTVRAAADDAATDAFGPAPRGGVEVTDGTEPKIHSSLPTGDPVIREIVEEFVETFDEKLRQMADAWDRNDMDELGRLAHWLRGAGGTVGFGCFTDPAAKLIVAVDQDQRDRAKRHVDAIGRVRERLTVEPSS